MSQQLFKRLEKFRIEQKLSILALCREMGAHNVTYHRWKNSGQITGPYKKIVEEFLNRKQEALPVKTESSCIAVIGMSCYYPGASNIRELWENILSRRVQFRRMLDQRLPLSEYYDEDPKAPEKTYLTKAAFLENFEFDWGKLRIPKKTVESTDIAHWLALDVALKTFEDAGYKLNEIPLQNTSVIVGNTLTGEQTRSQTLRLRWPYVQKVLNTTLANSGLANQDRGRIALEMEKIYKSAFYPITEDSLAGGLANTIAGRICNYLNLKGGGYIVDGACSSSLLAVATAANALKMGDADLVLAGGVDISLDPFELVGFAKAGALAKDKMSVYDQRANGFLPGEGCGFVLLKRLEDAVKDKNYIYATIKGWGISSDGKGGIMEPSSSGQSFAIGRAYKGLPYKICDVDFVEGHGTGTTKGDRVELEGIATAIDLSVSKKNKDARTCGVTSFKSIVGHTKAAAGVGGLIKAVLAVNQRVLPPTASCTEPNDVFKDKARNLYPLIQGGVLDKNMIMRAGISSAGFGGINCHVTVESKDDPRKELKSLIDEQALFVSNQETEVFVFASRTIIHLKKLIQKFKKDLRNVSIAEMADLAALLNKKVKSRLPIKIAIVTDSPEHLYEALALVEEEIEKIPLGEGQVHRIKSKDPVTHIILSNGVKKTRVGFLYPGQGSQRLNMTRVLVERFKWAKDLLGSTHKPLHDIIYRATDKFLTKEEQQEFTKQLADTKITQPAIIVSSLIWTEFLSKLGVEPKSTGGHSLGELTAFYKAGAFDKKTLIRFAELRGELMAAGGRLAGSMVSVFCSRQKAGELIKKVSGNIVIANINSPSQVVLSGGTKEIEKVIELAAKEDISTYRLNVSNAFHSSFMNEASKKISSNQILPSTFKSDSIQVCPCVEGISVNGKIDLREYFSKQMVSPVNFVGLVETMSKSCDILIEVGPGRVLTDLVKAINKNQGPICLPVESTAGNDRDLNIVLADLFVRNVAIQWEELYKNRLIKVFVPASKKTFIENQCERPLKVSGQVHRIGDLVLTATEPVIDVVQEQLEEKVDSTPIVRGKDNIADLLLDLTHKITGFDVSSISIEQRLLDDLNLDSIKAAELIGQAARTLGIAGQIDPSQLSNNTLGQIRDRLHELVGQSAMMGSVDGAGGVLKRYSDKMWVRNFAPDLIPEEIKTRNVNQFKALKNIVFLSESTEDSLADAIKSGLKDTKIRLKKLHFGDIDSKIEESLSADCLVAVLPSLKQGEVLSKSSLKAMLERAHRIVHVASSKQLAKDSFVIFVQFGGGITSLASTLYLERPDLKVRVIDFDAETPDSKVSSKIIDELQTYERFNVVGYDAQLARTVRYYSNVEPVDYKKRNIAWSPKDLVVVTGGAKGITAQCALEFARSTKAQMVLAGRSPMPENRKDETNEIIQTLKQFEAEGLKCHYHQCDVTNEKDVIAMVQAIERKFGAITGVVHGAGLNSLKRLKQSSVQEAFQEALPKVMGAVNICNALKTPPKLIVGITSIIGLTGMEGSGWYGLANEVLNLYLAQFKSQNPQTHVVTVAYSVWDEIGMGAKLGSVNRLAEKGIGAIPVAQGVKRFRQLVEGDPGVQQVIVAARVAGIDTWKSPTLKPNTFRFIEKIEYVLPGVELIAQAHLNVKDDSYLLDHNWKGSLLFPFVFGFEAMAQAVACVLGIEKFEHLKAKDINLQRPISVPQETGATIEIHAQVLEQETKNAHPRVKVEVYAQATAYKEPHFSAIFEIEPKIKNIAAPDRVLLEKAKNIIDLDIQTDIYGPILFQGKLFQCINNVHELYYETGKGACIFTATYNKSVNIFLGNNKKFNNSFFIGDPFFIDSVLQSMQLIVSQDSCLPNFIGEIEFSVEQVKTVDITALSEIKQLDSDRYSGDARTSGENGVFFIIKNCILKVLESLPDNPKANEIVNPSVRDHQILKDLIIKNERELGVRFPFISLDYVPGMHGLSKEMRHKIQVPFLNRIVNDYFRSIHKSVKFDIRWSRNGKPILVVDSKIKVFLSVTHEHNLLICTLGENEQAVDIQTISSRASEEWLSLLGEKKYKIVKDFRTTSQDFIGTAVWASSEAYVKSSTDSISNDLRIEKYQDKNYYILREGNDLYINIVVRFSRGNNKMLTFLLKNYGSYKEPELNDQLGFGAKYFHFDAQYSGPQGKLITSKKFPVTFKNSKSTSRRVSFGSYCEWIGEIREFALISGLKQLADVVETKEWGVATNNVKLDIGGELRGGDTVEGRIWLGNKVNDNVYDLYFEFLKHFDGESSERVALALQRISWVKILDHGVAKVNKLPLFLKDIMEKMEPRTDVVMNPEPFGGLFQKDDFGQGELIKNLDDKKTLLAELKIPTTMEESNLVGNIYFSNYPVWVSRTMDSYFYKLWPELYASDEYNGEFICKRFKIDHLNEAMPFDLIHVKMHLSKIYSRGIILEHEIFLNNGKKLAVAKQSLLWVNRDKNFVPAATNLPSHMLNKII